MNNSDMVMALIDILIILYVLYYERRVLKITDFEIKMYVIIISLKIVQAESVKIVLDTLRKQIFVEMCPRSLEEHKADSHMMEKCSLKHVKSDCGTIILFNGLKYHKKIE